MRGALLIMALLGAPPAVAQTSAGPFLHPPQAEPQLQLGRGNFSLPVIDYRAPDGTWKRSHGLIIGHDVSPGTAVGIGLFNMKPRYRDGSTAPPEGKSRKVAVGLSIRF